MESETEYRFDHTTMNTIVSSIEQEMSFVYESCCSSIDEVSLKNDKEKKELSVETVEDFILEESLSSVVQEQIPEEIVEKEISAIIHCIMVEETLVLDCISVKESSKSLLVTKAENEVKFSETQETLFIDKEDKQEILGNKPKVVTESVMGLIEEEEEVKSCKHVEESFESLLGKEAVNEMKGSSTISDNSSAKVLAISGDLHVVKSEVEIEEMVQNDDKGMSGVEKGEGNAAICLKADAKQCVDPVLKSGCDYVEQEGLMFLGKKRAGIHTGNVKQQMFRKDGNCFNRNVKGKVSETHVNQQFCQKKVNGAKIRYSRDEMESLRFLNVGEQQRMWNEVLCLRMGPVVAREYQDIADTNSQKKCSNNVVNRQRSAKRKDNGAILNMLKKKEGGSILGPVATNGNRNHLQLTFPPSTHLQIFVQ